MNRTSCLDEGRGWPFIYFPLRLKRSQGNFPYATGSLRSVIVISMHLMSRLAHRHAYLDEGNNSGKGTSNDNDYYYYCSKDVGKVVYQPHAESFPLLRLASPVICQPREHSKACLL